MSNCEKLIRECFALALQGRGFTAPNPLVGAVIEKNGEIIGRGYHQNYGGPHAEVVAINNTATSVEGATLYCNLEPCCHTNKQTPPCCDLIIEKKLAKVVISNIDPNPLVAGQGIKKLQAAGIEVACGILEEEGKRLNEVFFKFITTQMPFIHLKMAQSLDGRIATASGDAKWISNEASRRYVHQLRLQYDSVLIGRKTLNSDNPSLDIRMGIDAKDKLPYRIVAGNPANFNLDSKIFNDVFIEKTIILTTARNWDLLSKKNKDFITARGITIVECVADLLDWADLFAQLGKMKISSVLVEGGAMIFSSLINAGRYDKVSLFIAPKLLGNGIACYSNQAIETVSQAVNFNHVRYQNFDEQIMLEGYR